MDFAVQSLIALAPSVLLHLVRAGTFLITCPLFGVTGEGRTIRIMFSVSFGVVFWWVGNKFVPMPESVFELCEMIIVECFVGLLAGFCIQLLLAIPQIGGEILAAEMGFAISRIVNPATGASSTPLAQFFEAFATLLIFVTGLHHEVVRVLAATYDHVPVGTTFDYDLVFQRVMPLVNDTIHLGLLFAIPILGILLLLTVVLVLLSRAVSNINLMEFSFAVRILLALGGTVVMLGHSAPFLLRVFERLLGRSLVLFDGV